MVITTQYYEKKALTPAELVRHWEELGLFVPNRSRAERHLSMVGYYRLSGYAKWFVRDNEFYIGTTYDCVWNLYKFDRKLRLLTLDAIERIEVAIRAILTDYLCSEYGAHWFCNGYEFYDDKEKIKVFDILQKKKKRELSSKNNIFVHYADNYSMPMCPPFWMFAQVLDLGDLIHIFRALKKEDRRVIAQRLNLNHEILHSWLDTLRVVRNTCAHQARFWNIEIRRKPKDSGDTSIPAFDEKRKFYSTAIVIFFFLKQFVRRSTWLDRLVVLLNQYPIVDLKAMGFPDYFRRRQEPFWKVYNL